MSHWRCREEATPRDARTESSPASTIGSETREFRITIMARASHLVQNKSRCCIRREASGTDGQPCIGSASYTHSTGRPLASTQRSLAAFLNPVEASRARRHQCKAVGRHVATFALRHKKVAASGGSIRRRWEEAAVGKRTQPSSAGAAGSGTPNPPGGAFQNGSRTTIMLAVARLPQSEIGRGRHRRCGPRRSWWNRCGWRGLNFSG